VGWEVLLWGNSVSPSGSQPAKTSRWSRWIAPIFSFTVTDWWGSWFEYTLGVFLSLTWQDIQTLSTITTQIRVCSLLTHAEGRRLRDKHTSEYENHTRAPLPWFVWSHMLSAWTDTFPCTCPLPHHLSTPPPILHGLFSLFKCSLYVIGLRISMLMPPEASDVSQKVENGQRASTWHNRPF